MQIAGGAVLAIILHFLLGLPSVAIPVVAVISPWVMGMVMCLTCALQAANGSYSADWWRALWGEMLAATRINLFRQPWAAPASAPKPQATNPIKEKQAIPVLLLHGYVCNHSIWQEMAQALRNNGHPVSTPDLEPLFVSIDEYADAVQREVTALCTLTGASQIALIGHSMGGLVLRSWMRRYGDSQVRQAITLGAPHAGTRLSQWMSSPNGAQMQWHSEWLNKLALSEKPSSLQKMHIGLSAHDSIVFPQLEQTVGNLTPHVFKGIGHLQMCAHPEVIEWVTSLLKAK